MPADRGDLELEHIRAQIAHLNAETTRLQQETRWPPVVIAAILIALLGIVGQILSAVFGG